MRLWKEASEINSHKNVDLNKLQARRQALFFDEDDNGETLQTKVMRVKEEDGSRNAKLGEYSHTQKCLSGFVNTIHKDGKKTVVLCGSAKFGAYKGNPLAPNQKLLRELKRQCIVIMVPEYMSSQTCPRCNRRLPETRKWVDDASKKFEYDDKEEALRKVRGLLRCTCKQCKSKPYWDRDMEHSSYWNDYGYGVCAAKNPLSQVPKLAKGEAQGPLFV